MHQVTEPAGDETVYKVEIIATFAVCQGTTITIQAAQRFSIALPVIARQDRTSWQVSCGR